MPSKFLKKLKSSDPHVFKDDDEPFITIFFNEPVKGYDVYSGNIFTSDMHRVRADWARVNKEITEFLNDDSLTVAAWETRTIKTIQWPTGEKVLPSKDSYEKRMADIKKRYPNAWSKWTDDEDQQLIREFHNGMKIKDCSVIHGRARGGIISRLKKLGLIKEGNSTAGL